MLNRVLPAAIAAGLLVGLLTADPIAAEASTSGTHCAGRTAIGDANAPGLTAQLRLPILIADGAEDKLACAPDATDCSSAATLAAAEQPFYPNARVDAIVIPHAGHAVNLHRNADVAYRGIIAWTDRTLRGEARRVRR